MTDEQFQALIQRLDQIIDLLTPKTHTIKINTLPPEEKAGLARAFYQKQPNIPGVSTPPPPADTSRPYPPERDEP